MNELWKEHEEFPCHEISSLGKVRVLRRLGDKGPKPGTVLTGSVSRKGYIEVRIRHISGKHKLVRVHRLVLECFVGAAPNNHVAAHLDGNPANNTLTNLAWVTHKENQAHRVLHGTSNRGSRNPMYKHGNYSRY